MIYDYLIEKKNGEETLYVFLNFDEEFGKLGVKDKKKRLNEGIKEFIEKNKIDFKGTKVALISGGLLIGTLVFTNPIKGAQRIETSPQYTNSVVLMDEEVPSIEDIELPKAGNEVQKADKNIANSEKKEENVVKNENRTNQVATIPNKKAENNSSKPNAEEKKESVEHEKKDDNIYVTVKRASGQIEKIELEEYVIGVVSAEMPASFHTEALKTQAIIARTYALKMMERGGMLTDNSSTQNYKSIESMKAMWGNLFNTYYQKIKTAVLSTKGMYITYNGAIIDVVYHSTSNGKTENAENVWSNAFPYLVSVESSYDKNNPSFVKSIDLSYSDISAKLGIPVSYESSIEILGKTVGGRVENIAIDGHLYSGVKFRNLLGLRSADFDIVKTSTGLNITTRGYGHGVGLSQYGAQGMASVGFKYDAILQHYYKGVTLSLK